MKILKPGKVEQRKFVCPRCGCIFVAHGNDVSEDYVACPQEGCGYNQNWERKGEPYEEPTQKVKAVIPDSKTFGTLALDGKTIDVYLANIREPAPSDTPAKRILTLVEV